VVSVPTVGVPPQVGGLVVVGGVRGGPLVGFVGLRVIGISTTTVGAGVLSVPIIGVGLSVTAVGCNVSLGGSVG